MAAALALGKAKPPGARALLEKALSDAHPAVRTAAAAALAVLGDPAAISALEQHLLREGSGSVKSQMRASLDILKRRGAIAAASTKYFVQLGAMKNLTNVRGDQLGQVLRVAVHERAAAIPGAILAEDAATIQQAVDQHTPMVLLDGSLLRLAQGQSNGNVTFSAQVEFSIRKVPEHTLKATLSGGATSLGTQSSLGSPARVSALQDQAVDGAVESALRGASSGLNAAIAR